jgi:hypothetical protein
VLAGEGSGRADGGSVLAGVKGVRQSDGRSLRFSRVGVCRKDHATVRKTFQRPSGNSPANSPQSWRGLPDRHRPSAACHGSQRIAHLCRSSVVQARQISSAPCETPSPTHQSLALPAISPALVRKWSPQARLRSNGLQPLPDRSWCIHALQNAVPKGLDRHDSVRGFAVAAFMIRPILSTFLTGSADGCFQVDRVERLQTRPTRLSIIFQYNCPAPLEIGPALRCLTLCLFVYFVSFPRLGHAKSHIWRAQSPNSEIIPGPSTTATMLLSRKYAQRLSY